MSLHQDKVMICKLIVKLNQMSGEMANLSGQELAEHQYHYASASDLLMRHKVDYTRKGGLLLTHFIELVSEEPITQTEVNALTDFMSRMLGNPDSAIAVKANSQGNECRFNILVAEPCIDQLISLSSENLQITKEMVQEMDFCLSYIASLPTLNDVVNFLNSPSGKKNML